MDRGISPRKPHAWNTAVCLWSQALDDLIVFEIRYADRIGEGIVRSAQWTLWFDARFLGVYVFVSSPSSYIVALQTRHTRGLLGHI